MSGEKTCRYCQHIFQDHGWLDAPNGGYIVCPGDFILNEVENGRKGFYHVKEAIFKDEYEKASGLISLSA